MATPLVRTRVTENPAGAAAAILLSAGWTLLLTGSPDIKDVSGQTGGLGGQLVSILAYNTGAATRRVNVALVPATQTNNFHHRVFDEFIPPNGMILWQPRVPEKFRASTGVYGYQDAGSDIYVKIQVLEFY